MTAKSGALSTMVGGSHYREGSIQPIEFYMSNPQLDFTQTNMIKYAYRHKDKKHQEDLLKIIHYAMLSNKFSYGEEESFLERIYKLIDGDSIHESLRKRELQHSLYFTKPGKQSFDIATNWDGVGNTEYNLYRNSVSTAVASSVESLRDGGSPVPINN